MICHHNINVMFEKIVSALPTITADRFCSVLMITKLSDMSDNFV